MDEETVVAPEVEADVETAEVAAETPEVEEPKVGAESD